MVPQIKILPHVCAMSLCIIVAPFLYHELVFRLLDYWLPFLVCLVSFMFGGSYRMLEGVYSVQASICLPDGV